MLPMSQPIAVVEVGCRKLQFASLDPSQPFYNVTKILKDQNY